ncbi:MAG: PaaI family thioesterase [Actinobacteria bacterium]|nr:MAG: PaaI family thioesterase [Actinomycetota bacterium]
MRERGRIRDTSAPALDAIGRSAAARAWIRSRSLSRVVRPAPGPAGSSAHRRASTGPAGSLDGVSAFMGIRWDDPQTVRLQIRPELINAGGLLSGVVTYAMVDYCMGSTLWAQTTRPERIATISISINYVQTATEGELICRTELDRRNRSNAVMRSEVRHEDGRLLVTAIGSYAIFTKPPRAGIRAAAAVKPAE